MVTQQEKEGGSNTKIDKLTKEINSHFNDEIRVKNEIIEIQKNIANLIYNLKIKYKKWI